MNNFYKAIFSFALLLSSSLLFAQKQNVTGGVALDSSIFERTKISDSLKISRLRKRLGDRVDSLRLRGHSFDTLQSKFDSLAKLDLPANEKYDKLSAYCKRMEASGYVKGTNAEPLIAIGNNASEQLKGVDDLTSKINIDPIGSKGSQLSNIPKLPNENPLDGGNELTTDLNAQVNSVRENGTRISDGISNMSENVKGVNDLSSSVNTYSESIQSISENSSGLTEKIDAATQDQVKNVNEVKAIDQAKSMSSEEMELYKKAVEQYKNEKKIQSELEEKAKEAANDIVVQNQIKVDESIKKISRYKRKFSSVHDLRNLPKRATNPVKDLPLRERIVPGVSLQILNSTDRWLEFDPSVNYRLNGNWSAGIGSMFRFSMNTSKLSFSDFGSMYGYKTIIQYKAFKGFFLQGEGQRVTWKPWDTRLKDPDYRERVFVALIGIGKSQAISKRLKGSIQTFYHYAWGTDPYKPKIMLRFGIEFSLAKREKQAWERRLKELENCP